MKMKKFTARCLAAAVALSALLTAGCTVQYAEPEAPEEVIFTEDPTEAAVFVTPDGYSLTVPVEVAELTTVDAGAFEDGRTIITMNETASVEAAEKLGEDDTYAGWIFSISTASEDEVNEMRCYDMSGTEVFGKDADGLYYLYNHPTDVRLVRESYDDMEDDMREWGLINEWAYENACAAFIQENGLEPVSFGNSLFDMYLAQIRFQSKEYKLASLECGELEPGGVDPAPYLDKLMNGVTYNYVDEEAPDGEYLCLRFDENNERFDFFFGNELRVRRVLDLPDFQSETLYEAVFENESLTSTGIMQEWYDAVAKAQGLK